jgi:hypothetical protein
MEHDEFAREATHWQCASALALSLRSKAIGREEGVSTMTINIDAGRSLCAQLVRLFLSRVKLSRALSILLVTAIFTPGLSHSAWYQAYVNGPYFSQTSSYLGLDIVAACHNSNSPGWTSSVVSEAPPPTQLGVNEEDIADTYGQCMSQLGANAVTYSVRGAWVWCSENKEYKPLLSDCVCKDGFERGATQGSCVRVVDKWASSKPASCPIGNPIYPSTGSKREEVALGGYSQFPLTLVYDSARQGALMANRPPDARGRTADHAVGKVWTSSHHRSLLIDARRKYVAADRPLASGGRLAISAPCLALS